MPDTPTRQTPQPSTDQSRDTSSTHDPMTDHARATETDRPTTDRTASARPTTTPTLGDISHTNLYTNRTFGDTLTYGRGRVVAADGGEAEAAEEETLEDVDHTPADDDVDGAQGSFDRGKEPVDEPDDE